MISPILKYNSEVQGAYAKSDLKCWDSSQIEKTHLQFCKRYLEVSNKASNEACRAALGRFPLIIAINQKIMNSDSPYLQSKDNCSIVKQIFLVLQDLHHAGKNSYCCYIISMSEYYNFPCFDLMYLTNVKIKQYVSIATTLATYHQNSTKLEFFNIFQHFYIRLYTLFLFTPNKQTELVKIQRQPLTKDQFISRNLPYL